MTTRTFTGRKRLRLHSRWWYDRPILVLQVEVHEAGASPAMSAPPVDRTFWRDATVEDMTLDDRTQTTTLKGEPP